MNWVNVKNHLPPEEKDVLIVINIKPLKGLKCVIEIASRVGDHFFNSTSGEEVTRNGSWGQVTHWKKLPPLPRTAKATLI